VAYFKARHRNFNGGIEDADVKVKQDSWLPGRESYPGRPEYEAEELITWSQRQVHREEAGTRENIAESRQEVVLQLIADK
jgi:hypothetical protein